MKCMRITLLFMVFIGLTQIAVAESQSVTETSLPLKFDTGNPAPDGMPSIFITIQGKKLPILFDTGAKKTQLALTKQALKNIDVHFTGKEICFNAMDGKHCQKEFIIPEVVLGSFTIKNVKGVLMSKLWGGNDEDFIETEASKNGVVGFALLNQFNILLDYPQAKVILTKPQSKPKDYHMAQWTSVPFTDHFQTKLNINDKPVNLSWDTGASLSIIKASIAQNFPQTACPAGKRYSKKDCLRIEPTSFTTSDGKILPNTWFHVIDIPSYAPFDGLVGSNFYQENLVYFDFDEHKIFVAPVP